MLDSANYNSSTVNVSKSVSILAVPGSVGSVVATSGAAFAITTPGVKVALRNLVIVPLPGATGVGIFMNAGNSLTIEGCLIANTPGGGVNVGGSGVKLRITDSTIRGTNGPGALIQNGAVATITRATISGNSAAGVFIYNTVVDAYTTAEIADTTLDGNQDGVVAFMNAAGYSEANVTVKGSRVHNSLQSGLSSNGGASGFVSLVATDNVISRNEGSGIVAYNGGGHVWASGNTVSHNLNGLHNTVGLFESAGNNAVRKNENNLVGVITKVATE